MPTRPTVGVDVATASAITDTLGSLGKSVEIVSSLVGIHVDAVISVPFEATLAVMAAQQNPALAPNVLSYLVQRFVNPAVGPPITAYPWETEQTAALFASLLPYPLGPNATEIGLVNEARFGFADAFDNVLGQLPDPMPGFHAVQAVMNDTVLGGVVVAGQLLMRAPLYMGWNTVNYLGNLPVNLEAALESAIATPDRIPRLMSNLVYGLLSPDASVGLLGQLLNTAVDPFTWLSTPIGYSSPTATGLANQVRDAVTAAADGFLSTLPVPVTPQGLPVATASQSQPTYAVGAGEDADSPDTMPSASRAAITQAPAATADMAPKSTDSKVEKTAPATESVHWDADEADDADESAKPVRSGRPHGTDGSGVRPRRGEPSHVETKPEKAEPAGAPARGRSTSNSRDGADVASGHRAGI